MSRTILKMLKSELRALVGNIESVYGQLNQVEQARVDATVAMLIVHSSEIRAHIAGRLEAGEGDD